MRTRLPFGVWTDKETLLVVLSALAVGGTSRVGSPRWGDALIEDPGIDDT